MSAEHRMLTELTLIGEENPTQCGVVSTDWRCAEIPKKGLWRFKEKVEDGKVIKLHRPVLLCAIHEKEIVRLLDLITIHVTMEATQ